MYSDNKKRNPFEIAIAVFLIVSSFYVILMQVFVWSKEDAIRQSQQYAVWASQFDNGPVPIDKNSIGCTKYKYYHDVFWKCPVELGISSVEETRPKQPPKQVPVVSEISP